MRFKLTAMITAVALTAIFSGCNQTDNQNVTANANIHSNANANMATPTPVANSNANDTATRRAPTREEYERDKDRYSREAKESGRTVGTGLNDGWLWVKTRFDLAAIDDLRDSTINVDVDNAMVTLSGTVATPAQKTKADQTAKAVEGVKGVKNMLKVAADTSKAAASPTPRK